MLKIVRYCIGICAIVTTSTLTLGPAAAILPEDIQTLCTDYLENHFDEPEWEEACLDAMQQFESQSPPVTTTDQSQLLPTVSPALVVSAEIQTDGDRDSIVQTLRSGESADIIIEFEVRDVRVEAHARAIAKGLRSLSTDELEYKRRGYASVKQEGLIALQDVTVLRDFENLSTSFIRVANEAALDALLARPEVKAVHETRVYQHFLTESLPLIQQPATAAAGHGGVGTTIAVLDTGVDYTLPPFNCTSPGMPAGCRVVATYEAAADDFFLDDNGHGTNVSSIAASTAGDADIVVADVFAGAQALDPDILAAISWVIGNQVALNIVSMNVSFGDVTKNTTTCPADFLATGFADALAAGIQPIIASGNAAYEFDLISLGGFFVDGVASPACVPAAVRVGAVYDSNIGDDWDWNAFPFDCNDPTTSTDQVPCFSQSAPILSLLAPGAIITVPANTKAGTSMAAPHVAGAWAVMSAAMPNATSSEILNLLQDEGDPIIDPRPAGGRTTGRLNLFDALDEDGDGVLFALDTCTGISNAGGDQLDADHDGFGNFCDADFNQDNVVAGDDFGIFADCFGTGPPIVGGPVGDPTCEESDLTVDGIVSGSDFVIWAGFFGLAPGPSGLAGCGKT